jgi:hypothetical protein
MSPMPAENTDTQLQAEAGRRAWRDWQTWLGLVAFIGVALAGVPLGRLAPLQVGGINLTMALAAGLGAGIFGAVHHRRAKIHLRHLSQPG